MEEMDTLPGHRQTREMSLEQGLLIRALLLYTTSFQTGRVPINKIPPFLSPEVLAGPENLPLKVHSWWLSGEEFVCNAEDPSSIPGWARSPGVGMATHSSILAWRARIHRRTIQTIS